MPDDLWGGDAATTKAVAPVSDPLESWNRAMFSFNDGLYTYALRPVAAGYAAVVPQGGRQAVRNAFGNLMTPVYAVNALLQGKVEQAGVELARFGVNTLLGAGGLFEVAELHFGLKSTREDFGQTLGHYGADDSVYLVWPVLGPSTARDSVGRVADSLLTPWTYYPEEPWLRVGISSYDRMNDLSMHLEDVDAMKKAALDPYVAFRDAYLQMRKIKVSE
jgi:phospholipid-binding lipoprotein MlaA